MENLNHPNGVLASNIAPAIVGSGLSDVKKVVACQLFGGSRKKMEDNTFRRGDIHVLLIGRRYDIGLGNHFRSFKGTIELNLYQH